MSENLDFTLDADSDLPVLVDEVLKAADPGITTQVDLDPVTGRPDPDPEDDRRDVGRVEDPLLEEAAAKMFLDMPPAPHTLDEMWRHLMIRSIVNKLSMLRMQRYFEHALALIRKTNSRTEARVAHTEKQLAGVQKQLFDLRTGQQQQLALTQSIANNRAVEARLNGQMYQQLELRLAQEEELRRLQTAAIVSWKRSGWGIVIALIALAFAALTWSPMWR